MQIDEALPTYGPRAPAPEDVQPLGMELSNALQDAPSDIAVEVSVSVGPWSEWESEAKLALSSIKHCGAAVLWGDAERDVSSVALETCRQLAGQARRHGPALRLDMRGTSAHLSGTCVISSSAGSCSDHSCCDWLRH